MIGMPLQALTHPSLNILGAMPKGILCGGPHRPDNYKARSYIRGSIPRPLFDAVAGHCPDPMVFNGRASTLEDDQRNRLRAHTKPLRVPVRPRVRAHPI
jgi:hypothetical protein